MSISKLFAILVAAAMLFAPFAMQSGAAMAAMPSDHHAQMMDSGHCGEQPTSGKDSETLDRSCCVAMCTAIGIATVAPLEPQAFTKNVDLPSLTPFHHGFLAKLPTPPPRRS